VGLTWGLRAGEGAASGDEEQAQRVPEGRQGRTGRELGEGSTRAALGQEVVVAVAVVEREFPKRVVHR
jgi:hypothetical protein